MSKDLKKVQQTISNFLEIWIWIAESKIEKELVRICIRNMVNRRRVFLESHDVSNFNQLLEKASNITLSMKATPTFIKKMRDSLKCYSRKTFHAM